MPHLMRKGVSRMKKAYVRMATIAAGVVAILLAGGAGYSRG